MILGAIAGVLVVLGTDLLEYLRIDDPCGAWPVHGLCGIWGTLSLGLFATGEFGAATPTGADNSAASVVTGVFYGGGWHQFERAVRGQLLHRHRRVRRGAGDDVPRESDRHPARLRGRRTGRSRPPRARHPRLPRACHHGRIPGGNRAGCGPGRGRAGKARFNGSKHGKRWREISTAFSFAAPSDGAGGSVPGFHRLPVPEPFCQPVAHVGFQTVYIREHVVHDGCGWVRTRGVRSIAKETIAA